MKTVAETVGGVVPTKTGSACLTSGRPERSPTSKGTAASIDPQQHAARHVARVRRIFDRLAGMLGEQAFGREFGSPEAADEWALATSDLTDDQIKHGLQAVRHSGKQWPPSAAAFRELCAGTSAEAVYRELIDYLVRDQWFTTPLAYAVADRIGFDRIRSMTETALEKSMARAMKALAGRPLDPVPPRQTDPARMLAPPAPTCRERARAELAKIREAIGMAAGGTADA